ncbi:peptide-N(4)-(N-acetyl-beta-glucosaminyl)asparagine amidase-like [Mizuhopecten yessoensis]|uniref:Peptide-N(4)-(N-acetyl-beta-glucosaminyl)asparagine amidase n=1 Tax=Mizuhopecten yessoensis TaxID=6573 RepID=A0A210QVV9_MIZYE|nr:peptide-N(4)-(N-acetyl-beta-glucosaminyl)asparagine amidase-like [Mizuhopecten yessoensis]OWF52816.1 Peptide-N(4)-(N-acetyl-beta-glucosaminyl)asparagine amidase [Mizuhopecten yessoensis]
MAQIHSTVKQLITDNGKEDFLTASDILLKFADNIINHPNDPKYRKIRLSNPTVENKLLPVSGALECLFEMGFIEDGEFLTFPASIPPTLTLIQVRNELHTATKLVRSSTGGPSTGQSTPRVQQPAVTPSAARQIQLPAQTVTPMSRQAMQQAERQFFMKIESSLVHVLNYERRDFQQKARSVIPMEELNKEAKKRFSALQTADKDASAVGLQDCVLLSLLAWFKNSFFKWVDAPECDICQGKTRSVGPAEPSQEDLRWGASRVENYRCDGCNKFVRFPRYNDPGKLLDTRRGRCGEWANCFTLCCRTMGFEARYVLDWTDHVWTEVYSTSQKRWLHCDPCENACDKPLLYEVGWGKKLTYVIAFSKDEVQDVSWRYSANFKEMMSRRKEVRENWLGQVCFRLWNEKNKVVSEERRKEMSNRCIVELVEFITQKKSDKNDLSGRTTGSLTWRLARGETGNTPQAIKEPFVFTLTDSEKQGKLLHVRYNCAKDEYTRVTDENKKMSGFGSCLFKSTNVFRKEEHDWKMVYLARTEGSAIATLSWKFDFKGSGLKVRNIEICVKSSTYENGVLSWRLCSDNQCAILKGTDDLKSVSDLNGVADMTLTANLSGGKGDVAWQHTQLFRQTNTDFDIFPFEVKIYLE